MSAGIALLGTKCVPAACAGVPVRAARGRVSAGIALLGTKCVPIACAGVPSEQLEAGCMPAQRF